MRKTDMEEKIPQSAIDSIAKYINQRNNKSYGIFALGIFVTLRLRRFLCTAISPDLRKITNKVLQPKFRLHNLQKSNITPVI